MVWLVWQQIRITIRILTQPCSASKIKTKIFQIRPPPVGLKRNQPPDGWNFICSYPSTWKRGLVLLSCTGYVRLKIHLCERPTWPRRRREGGQQRNWPIASDPHVESVSGSSFLFPPVERPPRRRPLKINRVHAPPWQPIRGGRVRVAAGAGSE